MEEFKRQLLVFQDIGESKGWRVLNKKYLEGSEMDSHELDYHQFYAKTFLLETIGMLLFFPAGLFFILFNLERKKEPANIRFKYLSFLSLGLATSAALTINLNIYTAYRRRIYNHPFESEIKRKYVNEIRKLEDK